MERVIGFFGIFILLGLAYLFSNNRRQVSWRLVGWGMGLQILFALLILGVPTLGVPGVLRWAFDLANDAFVAVLNFTDAGSAFIFGPLIDVEKAGGFIFAFKVLPTIIFFSSLMGVFYHLGVMQFIVRQMAWLMQKTMKTSGAESLSAAANIFVGQTEAPLIVKPYVHKMTMSELMCVMTGGMATVAGGVMAAYVGLLRDRMPDIAGHLLTASVMSAPAALVLAKILIPETEKPATSDVVDLPQTDEMKSVNVIEAAASGAADGVKLAVNVGAMLLAFIALIAMVNGLLAFVGTKVGFASWGASLMPEALAVGGVKLSLELFLAWLFAPLAFVMGVPFNEVFVVGQFLGQKIVLNEFVAYVELSKTMGTMSDRAILISSYALCGFANFSSIAIQIGGIGTIAPSRKSDLAKLGLRSILGGMLAACLTATIAGILI